MKFQWYNTRLSCSYKVLRLLVLLLVLSKEDFKISVSSVQIQNFKDSNLALARVQKVNIAITYLQPWTRQLNQNLLPLVSRRVARRRDVGDVSFFRLFRTSLPVCRRSFCRPPVLKIANQVQILKKLVLRT